VIYGLETGPLPDNYTPLEAISIVKCLDDEGDVVLVNRCTDGLKVWDIVGLLTVTLDDARAAASESFVYEIDDEEDEDDG
jgi:hypothetical protein